MIPTHGEDFFQGIINRIKLDGTGREYFAQGAVLGKPSALAIDWLTRNLYYTNPTGR